MTNRKEHLDPGYDALYFQKRIVRINTRFITLAGITLHRYLLIHSLQYVAAIKNNNYEREIDCTGKEDYLVADYLPPNSSWTWCPPRKALEKGSVLEVKIMKDTLPNRKKMKVKRQKILQVHL